MVLSSKEQKGVVLDADFDPNNNNTIYITNNTIQNVNIGIQWQNKDVVGSNMLPSVIVDGNYIRAVHIGNLFNKQGKIVDGQKAWVQFSNNTLEQITGVVFEPPIYYVSNGVAGSTPVALGRNSFDGNVNINMDGVTMPPDAYSGVSGPLSSNTTAGIDIPDANGEHHIAIDPDPSYPFTNYAADVWHGNNVSSPDIAPAKPKFPLVV